MRGADVSRCDGDDVLRCRDGSLLTATGCVPEGEVVARKNHVVYCGMGQTIDNGACHSCSVQRCRECFNATNCAVCNGFPQEDGQFRKPARMPPSRRTAVTSAAKRGGLRQGERASRVTCSVRSASCAMLGGACPARTPLSLPRGSVVPAPSVPRPTA